jgi:hypothetical protein
VASLLTVVVLASWACAVAADGVPTLTFQVDPKKTICLYENITPGQVTASWEVVRGGLLDINIGVSEKKKKKKKKHFFFVCRADARHGEQITGPTGESYYSELYFEGRGTPGYKTFMAANGGRYSFCFNNEMSRWTPKVVSFALKIGNDATPSSGPVAPAENEDEDDEYEDDDANGLAKQEHVAPLQDSISKISGALAKIENEQSYYRRREHRHRNTAEETCERVQWWSIYETSAIILISVVQVLVLRRWFDSKRTHGGV